MLDRLKRKMVKEYQENLSFLSEVTVKTIIKKELGKKAFSMRKEIKQAFKTYSERYIKICRYLRDDFKQKYVYDDYEAKTGRFDMGEEIEVMEGTYNHLVKHKIFGKAGMRGITIMPLQNTLDKWKILNDLFREYPKRLEHLRQLSHSYAYKDFNINDELSEMSKDEAMMSEDFSMIIKKIKEDKDGHDNSK